MPGLANIPQSILQRLAPDYREFIEANPPPARFLHKMEWSPMFRQLPADAFPDMGSSSPIPVGSQRTIELGHFSIQVMTPEGEKPNQGWPVLIYVHGGGWVFGTAAMDNEALSRLCVEARCVTVSVEYRLAPEHPFPAGLDDSWNALLWLRKEGKVQLGIDIERMALMGPSAGANLVAVLAQRACLASPKIPLVLQILVVPVIDASFSATDRSRWTPSMIEHEHIYSLSTLDMLWLRDRYLPNVEDRTKPEASPIYQENKAAFDGMPHTWIAVAELDALRSEGEMYAEKLQKFGVPVTLKLMKGLTHSGPKTDRVCETARASRDELIKTLKEAFA